MSSMVGRGTRHTRLSNVLTRAYEVHTPPFTKRPKNPLPVVLPARKKHNAVPPQLLNADPLAQIISTETIADVIIDDVEACALLD